MNNYIVYRVYQHTNQRHTLYEGLTREEAMSLVQDFPSEDGSMVVFDKQ